MGVLVNPKEVTSSFVVNHDGEVYEKDFGKNTIESAKKMNRFDPDKSWEEVVKAVMP